MSCNGALQIYTKVWDGIANNHVLLLRKARVTGLVYGQTHLDKLPQRLNDFASGVLPASFWQTMKESNVIDDFSSLLGRLQEPKSADRQEEL